jgi:hypothetical protein
MMAQNQEQRWQDMTLNSLEAKLRSFSLLEAPETLKAKLFAAIPAEKAKAAQQHRAQWWRGIGAWGTAAAAVVILALIFVPDYGPSMPSQTLIADLNDRPVRNLLTDQNNALVEDINYVSRSRRQ